jgi:hypothetical protein
VAVANLDGIRIKLDRAHRHIQDLRQLLDQVTTQMNSLDNIYGE